MAIAPGETGSAVEALQRSLNKLGALLIVDGEFGPATEAAVLEAREVLNLPGDTAVDDSLLAALERVEDPSPELTAAGVTFIAREEVSSPAAYRKRYRNPVWPGGESGITIGIGYDLRFVGGAKLFADWGDVLPAATLDRLLAVTGRKGDPALRDLVADVVVPLYAAVHVFLRHMLPDHMAATRRAFPQLDALPPSRRTALVSLVFNRGASLSGESRREMRRIRELLASELLDPVAEQIELMTRLWDRRTQRGLIERRLREARLWRGGFEALHLV